MEISHLWLVGELHKKTIDTKLVNCGSLSLSIQFANLKVFHIVAKYPVNGYRYFMVAGQVPDRHLETLPQ